jgi:hypothetical protein
MRPGGLSGLRRATPGDRGAIAALDAIATGLDRRDMLEWLQEGAPDLAWVVEGGSGIEGALLGRPGHTANHLGPLIATSPGMATPTASGLEDSASTVLAMVSSTSAEVEPARVGVAVERTTSPFSTMPALT